MTQKAGARMTTALAGIALLLAAAPAPAQNYPQTCRTVNGRLVCSPAANPGSWTGGRAYERWGNGAPAYGSSGPVEHRFPYTMGSYHTWYGFGH